MRSVLLAAAALVVALPAGAASGTPGVRPSMAVVEVPLHGERALTSSRVSRQFDLVGLHWLGSGTVRFRTHRLGGRWSVWHAAAPEADDRPDTGSAEARRSGEWRLGSPWWVGRSDRIEYALRGDVRRLRAYLVTSPDERIPIQSASRSLASATGPAIVTRSSWHADESIVRSGPQYADSLRFAVVHHTAGSNDYTQEEAPAVVRAIELYHVEGNGWNDIGYNFLLDRFGTVYEGRAGGTDRNVVGAHALGFNRGSVGIAVLGTYIGTAPPQAAMDSLAHLLAWRLDLAHIDPLSSVTVTSGGSERYSAGTPVALRAVSGHMDTGLTACPGKALYAKLGALAAKAQALGLPKIYAPVVTGQLGGEVRFEATVSGAVPWTAAVLDQAGATVASGSGVGPAVDWSWDSSAAAAGSYSWQLTVAGATPATGTLGTAAPVATTLELTDASVEPATISPNSDGEADAATVTYATTMPAVVTVTIVDVNNADVAVLHGPVDEVTGTHTLAFTGEGLADGRYSLRIDASSGDTTVSRTVGVVVTRTLGSVAVSPPVFSPNQDGRADRLAIGFTLLNPAAVRVRVLRDGKWIATVFSGDFAAGRRSVRWDGSKRLGKLLDGAYTAEVDATDTVATSTFALPFTADTRAPTVRILPGKPLRVWVSEPALLALRVSGRALSVRAAAAGNVRIPWAGPAGRVRAVAWDAAGNVSRPALRP